MDKLEPIAENMSLNLPFKCDTPEIGEHSRNLSNNLLHALIYFYICAFVYAIFWRKVVIFPHIFVLRVGVGLLVKKAALKKSRKIVFKQRWALSLLKQKACGK